MQIKINFYRQKAEGKRQKLRIYLVAGWSRGDDGVVSDVTGS